MPRRSPDALPPNGVASLPAVSSVAAPEGAAAGPLPAASLTRSFPLRWSGDALLGTGLGVLLALLAFVTTGGVDLGPNTWTEILLVLIAAGLAIAVLLIGAPGRAWGLGALLLFVALAAITALSIGWSVVPDLSWVEANRTVSYLAAFGSGLAVARLFPERWPAMVGAIALAATLICAEALLVKVFPAALDPNDLIGRISAPFDYWNASGLIAALGVPACLWAGARRDRGRVLRALSMPALSVLLTVLILSYSRSALLAAVVGLACWFAFVPLRLRGVVVLAVGAAGAAFPSLWALSTRSFTHDLATLHSRTVAGHGFGLVLLFALALTTVVGFAASFAMDRTPLPARTRRRIGVVLVTLVALVPVAGVAGLAASSRGLPGEVSHIFSTLTSSSAGVGDTPGRLVEVASSRPRYWHEGIEVAEHALLKGVGAAGYGVARTRYATERLVTGYAHSFVIETLADFGLIGSAIALGLLVAWAIAAARAVRRSDRGHAGSTASGVIATDSPERLGLLTLLVIVVVFGVHSAIDWTWFIPGTAVPALVCAGWLAGRGPLAAPVGRAPRRRRLLDAPGLGAAVIAGLGVTIVVAWAMWQPLRSANADAAAITAIARGDGAAAVSDAQAAISRDPVAVQPLFDLGAIYAGQGEAPLAHQELVRATVLQPQNPATWETLGEYELGHNHPAQALSALLVAHRLDLGLLAINQNIAQARADLRAAGP
jgi:O-Antigen ligase